MKSFYFVYKYAKLLKVAYISHITEDGTLKKLMIALLTITLIFSPIGNFVFNDSPVAEAKRYKSGKKSFNTNKQQQPTQSNIQKDKDTKKADTQKNTQTPAANKGGLMKGLLVGGLAGLLFGSLFANMGVLGSILGLMINVAAIVFLIFIVRKVFGLLRAKKREEDARPWGQ